jgi:alanine racemase
LNSEKYLTKLFGRRDIEDALSRLDRMTQEMARMALATVQVLEVAHNVDDGFKTVGKGVEDVDDKVNDVDNKDNLVIEGTFSTLATRTCHRKPTHD